jgi:succinyl-CoA synthetase beta subunit
MDLLEYQAKELFREMGIPVLPSQRISQPKDLKDLKVPYPIVLKSQVYRGGRGKAGGIKFAANTIDAIAAAQVIFNLPISGSYPDVLLAEVKYSAEREFYLAVVLDSSTRRPVLIGSQFGGIDVVNKLDQMCLVVVEQDFSPFYARRLALKMGLTGNLMQTVSSIVEKMYALFAKCDLDLIEINPLAINSQGDLMALDGKVTVNDAAIARHPILSHLVDEIPQRDGKSLMAALPSPDQFNLLSLEGTMGLLCNGAGLTMTTLDLIRQTKAKLAGYVDLGGEYHNNYPANRLQALIEQGLTRMAQERNIKIILVNILGGMLNCRQVAAAIAQFLSQPRSSRLPQLVVRLTGDCLSDAQQQLADLGIPALAHIDDAIAKAVLLTK